MRYLSIFAVILFFACYINTLYAKNKNSKVNKSYITYFNQFIIRDSLPPINFRTNPGEDCSSAGSMTLPTTIPTCQTIATTMPQFASSGNTFVLTYEHTSSTTTPYPDPECNFFSGYTPDTWYTFTIPANVHGFQLNAIRGDETFFFPGTTYSGLMVQAYTGTNCNDLTTLNSCQTLLSYERVNPAAGYVHTISNGTIINTADSTNVTYTGLTPGTTIFLRLYSYRVRYGNGAEVLQDGTFGKTYDQDDLDAELFLNLLPKGTNNSVCSACTNLTSNSGCNLGNSTASWTAPSVNTSAGGGGVLCNGVNWTSIANPTYYCLSITSNSPTVSFANIQCNNFTNLDPNSLRVAAFTSCSSVGNYTGGVGGSNFIDCWSGDNAFSFPVTGVSSGQNIILVVDSERGENCRWDIAASGAFPLQLLTFTAKKNNLAIQVDWSITDEMEIDNYIIEKSADGTNWGPICNVPADHNPSLNYTFSDENPLTGSNYYRIRIVRKDNNFSYSKIVSVNFGNPDKNAVLVQPNPFTNSFSFSFNSDVYENGKVEIKSMDGKTILLEENISISKGFNKKSLNTEYFKEGMYLFILSYGNTVNKKKIVKVVK